MKMVYIGEDCLSNTTRLVKNTLYDCKLVQNESINHGTKAIYQVINSQRLLLPGVFIHSHDLIPLEKWREIRLKEIGI